jgi:uncharacterized protein
MKKNKFNIKQEWIDILYNIFEKTENLDKVILFGSRARGDHKLRSDIDLAIQTVNIKASNYIINKIEESNILLKVDIIDLNYVESNKFLENVKNQGIVFWERGN